ncbi:MAG: hypothetical protein AAF738_02905 [Bacteroidota bacterium]
MRLLLLIPFIFSSIFTCMLFAQVEIDYPEVSAENVVACNPGTALQIRLRFTDATADNASVTIEFPTGIAYEPGSLFGISSLTGLSVVESDISDLNRPVFTVTPADIQAGDQVTFYLRRSGGCEAVAFANGGGTFKDVVVVTTDAGVVREDDPAVNSYNLLAASLVVGYTSAANQTANTVPDSFNGALALTQGGLGSVPAVRYYVIVGSGLSNYTLKYNGTALTPDATNADTLFYDFSEAAYPGIFGGNGSFENGEQVLLSECFDIESSCDQSVNNVVHGAYWGCSATDICQRASEVTGSVSVLPTAPTVTYQSIETIDPLCMDATSRGRSVHRFTNTSTASAILIFETQAAATAGLGVNNSSQIGVDSSSTIISVDGVDVTDNVEIRGVGSVTGACAAGLSDDFVGDVQYRIILEPGQVLDVSFEFVQCCPVGHSCGSNRNMYNPFMAYQYRNVCEGIITTARPFPTNDRHAFIRGGSGVFSGPAQMVDGQTEQVCVEYVGIAFPPDYSGDSQVSIEIPLPPGFSLNSPGTITAGGANVLPITSGPSPGDMGTLTYVFETADFESSGRSPLQICIDVEYTCAPGAGNTTNTFETTVRSLSGASCASSCNLDISCTSNSISSVCSETCPEGGGTVVRSSAQRQNLGFEDLDNDRAYDSNVLADPAVVRLDRASPCDTICVLAELEVIDGTSGPTWTDGLFTQTVDEAYLTAISAEVEVFDNGALVGTVANVTPSNVVGGVTFEYDLSGTALNTVDPTFPAAFTYDADDSVAVRTCYRIDPTLASDYYNYNFGFAGTTAQCTGDLSFQNVFALSNNNFTDRFSCNPSFSKMTLIATGLETFVQRGPGLTRDCQQTNTYFYHRGQRGCFTNSTFDWYPNEFRPIYRPDVIEVELLPGLNFERFTVEYTGNPLYTFTSPTSVVGTTLFFDVGSLMNDQGGPLRWREERFQIIFRAFFTSDCTYDEVNRIDVPTVLTHSDPVCNIDYRRNELPRIWHQAQPDLSYSQNPVVGSANTANTCFGLDAINNSRGAASDLPFTWLTIIPSASSGMVVNSVTKNGGAPIPLNTNANIYELGAHPNSTVQNMEICVTPGACMVDSFQVVYATSCSGYPSTAMESDVCQFDTLTYFLQPVGAGLQTFINAQPDPNAAADICEQDEVEVVMNSSSNADVVNPAMEVMLPPGFLPVTAEVEYPIGMNPESLPFTQTGSTVSVDFTQHSQIMNNSLPGIVSNPGTAGRQILLRFTYETTCDYDPSNAALGFVGRGNDPCGDPAQGDGGSALTNPILVNGAAPPYTATPTLTTADNDLSCNENAVVNIEFTITGGNTTGNDFAEITVPSYMTYVPGSINCTSPNPAACPGYNGASTNAAGDNVYTFVYPSGIMDGTTVAYDVAFEETGVGGCDGFEVLFNNLTVLPSLSCMGVDCGMPIRTIAGTGTLNFATTKPILSFTGERFCAPTTLTNGAEYFATLNVTNADVQAGEMLSVDISCSSNRSAVLETIIVNGPITAGSSVDLSGTFGGVCASTTDSLVFTVTPTVDNCVCDVAEGVAGPVDDTADTDFVLPMNVCSGNMVTLTPNVPGGVFSGADVTDNGDGSGGVFNPTSIGTYEIAYTVMNPGMGCSITSIIFVVSLGQTIPGFITV